MYALNINVLNQQNRNGFTMWNTALEYLIETDNSAVMTLLILTRHNANSWKKKTPHTQYVNSHHRASRVMFSSLSQEEI